jgi:hypothetical protein
VILNSQGCSWTGSLLFCSLFYSHASEAGFSDKTWSTGFTPAQDRFQRFTWGVPPKLTLVRTIYFNYTSNDVT